MADTKTSVTWACMLLVALVSGSARAQEEPAEPDAVAEAIEQAETEAAEEKVPSPAVDALLASNPETPAEMARVAELLVDLEEFALAKEYLGKVLAANLDEQQLAGLHAEIGGAAFVKFASRLELAPEGGQLAQAVLAAVREVASDPARLSAMIEQLQDPSARKRMEALDELRKAPNAAVGALVAVLANPPSDQAAATARAALVDLHAVARKPLLAVLESGNVDLVVQVIDLLADMNAREAALFLLAPAWGNHQQEAVTDAARRALTRLIGEVPDKDTAVAMLMRESRKYFGRSRPEMGDGTSPLRFAVWNDEALTSIEIPADQVCLILAARFARDAHHIAPENDEVQLLFLATQFELSAVDGLEGIRLQDASEIAAKLGVEKIERVLTQSMEHGYAAAAMEAIRVLARLGSAETLLYDRATPSPLVQAAGDKDRRVRHLALKTIAELDVTRAHAGASTIAPAAEYLARSTGTRRALVAGPVTAESLSLAGYLTPLGYEVDTATNGQDLTRLLIASPDYEIVLIDPRLSRPEVDVLLQQLRHDNRAALVPIGLIARADRLAWAERVASRDPLTLAFPRPHSQEDAAWQVDRMTSLVPPPVFVDPGQRLEMAAEALSWLAEWNLARPKVYPAPPMEDALLTALYVPTLEESAVKLLATMATPTAQTTLVDLASRQGQPIKVRVAAADGFWDSVQRFGILLTSNQIERQYDRYNASEHQGEASQKILGSILDCLEAPLKAASGD